MKEFNFIRSNIDKWQKAEIVISDAASQSPDRLAEVYTDLTSDLAFAQTHYPQSRITIYLNKLCSALHNSIYRNKREKWSRLITYWTREVPLVMYEERKLLLVSFIISWSVSSSAFCRNVSTKVSVVSSWEITMWI